MNRQMRRFVTTQGAKALGIQGYYKQLVQATPLQDALNLLNQHSNGAYVQIFLQITGLDKKQAVAYIQGYHAYIAAASRFETAVSRFLSVNEQPSGIPARSRDLEKTIAMFHHQLRLQQEAAQALPHHINAENLDMLLQTNGMAGTKADDEISIRDKLYNITIGAAETLQAQGSQPLKHLSLLAGSVKEAAAYSTPAAIWLVQRFFAYNDEFNQRIAQAANAQGKRKGIWTEEGEQSMRYKLYDEYAQKTLEQHAEKILALAHAGLFPDLNEKTEANISRLIRQLWPAFKGREKEIGALMRAAAGEEEATLSLLQEHQTYLSFLPQTKAMGISSSAYLRFLSTIAERTTSEGISAFSLVANIATHGDAKAAKHLIEAKEDWTALPGLTELHSIARQPTSALLVQAFLDYADQPNKRRTVVSLAGMQTDGNTKQILNSIAMHSDEYIAALKPWKCPTVSALKEMLRPQQPMQPNATPAPPRLPDTIDALYRTAGIDATQLDDARIYLGLRGVDEQVLVECAAQTQSVEAVNRLSRMITASAESPHLPPLLNDTASRRALFSELGRGTKIPHNVDALFNGENGRGMSTLQDALQKYR